VSSPSNYNIDLHQPHFAGTAHNFEGIARSARDYHVDLPKPFFGNSVRITATGQASLETCSWGLREVTIFGRD